MTTPTCEIVILETSDLHGFMRSQSYATQKEVNYGFARIASIIKEIRKQQPHTLLIDNGDCLQGTPLTYYHAKVNHTLENPVISCMNELHYDAAVLGNHEFNYGLRHLEHAVHASNFPWLSANTINSATQEPLFKKPYLIKELPNGIRIGILGLTTSYIPNWEQPQHIEGIRFDDPIATAKQWVKHMKTVECADIVIVSFHGGFERDLETGQPTEPLTGENVGYALCEQVEGIDVLLTGHQHRSIEGYTINGVCVVQPANEGRFLGKVTLQMEKSNNLWRLKESKSELIEASHYQPDNKIAMITNNIEKLTQTWLDQPIGFIEGDKDMLLTCHAQARLHEHPLVDFINQLQMDISGAAISCTALFDNLAPGFGNQITMRDIVTNYIYPNTLKVIQVSGQDIRDALESTAAYFETNAAGEIVVSDSFLEPKPQHYNYDMWEGIHYILDVSRPIGQRVITLQQFGQPLDNDKLYDVVMNNYRAAGGGNYAMFQNKPVIKDIPTDMVELIADYIQANSPIKVSVNHNWKVINGSSLY